jgi:3-methyladenine DNA glycosylase/8-oxoguanine DNA glycosylase
MTASLTTEHPSWHPTDNSGALRVVEHNDAIWTAHWTADALTLRPIASPYSEAPPVAYTSPINLPTATEAQPLVDELVRLGTVQRLTNPSLWDAIATALLRQVVRADQAKKVYRAFCHAYGTTVTTAAGPLAVMPGPDTVLALSDAAFADVGAAFNRSALRSAATAYKQHGAHWRTLDADQLVKELISVRRIGPWTAAAATADFTGDHSVYPHGDLAVRTWARRAAPQLDLPTADREFEALWRRWAPSRTALHTLTLLTLTWGSHARSTQHEGHPRR